MLLEQGEFFREQFIELFGDGIFGVDGQKWTYQRKTASHLFSRNGLRGLMSKYDRGRRVAPACGAGVWRRRVALACCAGALRRRIAPACGAGVLRRRVAPACGSWVLMHK